MIRNERALSILMRAKISPCRPTSPSTNRINQMHFPPQRDCRRNTYRDSTSGSDVDSDRVRDFMRTAMSTNNSREIIDAALVDFSDAYRGLPFGSRQRLLLTLSEDYYLNRFKVCKLMKEYLDFELPSVENKEGSLSAVYSTERRLRQLLKPMYENFFERLNDQPGGLEFLTIMRQDILDILKVEDNPSLEVVDSYLKEKILTGLSPENLQFRSITWDDPASLLEKIVAYEAVHPISNLSDLKQRLGVGRRCFAYFHPSIPGEPLVFVEVALMENVAQTIEEVLSDDSLIPETEATSAVFYSISSPQRGLSGIHLGKLLIKRVIDVVRKDMPNISTFATLSPIPEFMPWLLRKLESTSVPDSCSDEYLLKPEEEETILGAADGLMAAESAKQVMLDFLKTEGHKWIESQELSNALKAPLMRLCARYLLKSTKSQKVLDPVENFHLQNGAAVGRINWKADRSHEGLKQSAGLMVNYIYDVKNIEENGELYRREGRIAAYEEVRSYI